jgi:anti-sigma regulatory factor (Ser/Thr protein kinase)
VTPPTRLTCAAQPECLPSLLRFVEEACVRSALSADDTMAVRLSVEEVCENIIKYGYVGREPGPVSVDITGSDERVEVTVEDRGARFDPRGLPPADVTSDWAARPVGGLGWHLVRNLMDEVRYEPMSPDGNRVTLVKRRNHNPSLRSADAGP